MIMDPSYKEDMIEQLNSLTNTDKNKLPDSIENLLKNKTMTENLTIEGKDIIETPTMGGLWLIREPELVYNACNGEMHNIGSTAF